MGKSLLIYGLALLLMLTGLLCLSAAVRKKSTKETMMQAVERPLPKNYGNPFLWMFGLFCIAIAVVLVFKRFSGPAN
jgi:hypothetical protein